MATSSTAGRTGRRGGTPRTREAIATAARTQFADLGYERSTFRSIATAAGVDPALIVHFYGSKDELFRQVMQLPEEISAALVQVAEGERAQMGRRLAQLVVGALENPGTRPVVLGRIRCASSHQDAAALVRETVTRDLSALTRAITDDRPDVRAVLVGAHVVGIALARYVVRVEPLVSIAPAELVDLLAPSYQQLLCGPLAD